MILSQGIRTIFQIALALLKVSVSLCSLSTLVLLCMQISRKDLLSLDFEGIMKYFRVHLPKKFTTDEECVHFFQTIDSMKVRGERYVQECHYVLCCYFRLLNEN